MHDGTLSGDDTATVPSYITIRKSATDPSNAKNIELYKKGVAAMKATPFPIKVEGTNTTWWEAHASIHDNFCPHGNWFFLPWHRGYLHHFEKVIREFCGDSSFALPYWDWSEDLSVPEAFTTGDEESNALFNATRRLAVFIAPQSIDPSKDPIIDCRAKSVQDKVDLPDFLSFAGGPSHNPRALADTEVKGYSGALEIGPHNRVHAIMQGDMGTFRSPLDPIFWLHHCNIDRIWSVWAAARTLKDQDLLPPIQNPKNTDLTAKYWSDHKIGGYYSISKEGEVFKAAPAEMIVFDVYDAIKMGLAYQPYVKITATPAPSTETVQAPTTSVPAAPVASTPVVTPDVAAPVNVTPTPVPADTVAVTPAPATSAVQSPTTQTSETKVTVATAPVVPAPVTSKSLKSRWKSVLKVIKLNANHIPSFSLITAAPAIIKIEGSTDLNEALLNGAMEWKGSHAVVLRLIVDNIPFPTNPLGQLQFYMNAANPTVEESNPSFIGNINFFGHKHEGATVSAAFDLVPTVKKLTAGRKFPFDSSGAKPLPVVITAFWKTNTSNDDLSKLSISLDYVKTEPRT